MPTGFCEFVMCQTASYRNIHLNPRVLCTLNDDDDEDDDKI